MDTEAKINQVVNISPAYATEVSLKDDFLRKPEENRRKLRGYVPNKSSRAALKSICEGLHPTSTKRVHLITGTYGTGKSHFGLVVANFVSRDIDEPDFSPLLDKLRERDDELTKHILSLRKAQKRFLLVLPEPHWDPEGFHHSLLTALAEALSRENISYRPSTHFTAALERIEDWRKQRQEAYEKLQNALLSRSVTVQQLTDGLKAHKGSFYEVFEEVHKEVAYGATFEPIAYSAPRDVFADTIKYLRSTGEWAGIFIIYDEFGRYLSEMANAPESFDAQNLQKFAEYCKRTSEEQCHFMVIAHQTIADYARGKRTQEEWQKIYGRFISGKDKFSITSSEHDMEELIPTIITKDRDNPLWADIEHQGDFNLLADEVMERKLYSNKTPQWIEQILLRGAYPLHPYTTFALPFLSDRVGQSHRTLFTFLGDEDENGLRYFVQNNSILTPDGRLNLYTLDNLIYYFDSAIRQHDESKAIMQSSEDALAAVGDNPQAMRIINSIAVLMILRVPKLPPTKEVIAEALHVPASKKQEIYNILEELAHEKEVLRFRRATGHYELPRGAGDISVREAVQKERRKLLEGDFDWRAFVKEKVPPEPIQARKYQEAHFVERKAAGDYIAADSLSNPKPFLDKIDGWYHPDRGKYEGDLLVLFVLADSDAELKNAKDFLNQARDLEHSQLIVAVPKQPVSLSETALDLKAAENLKASSGEIGQQLDPVELEDFIEDVEKLLRERIDEFIRADNLVWHCNGNVTNNLASGGEEEYISQIMEQVFPKTPLVKDTAIANPIATRDSSKSHRKDAMDILLQTKGPFQIAKTGGQATDRILRACVKDTDLAEKVGDRGKSEEFEIRAQPPPNSPLAEIWQFLEEMIIQQNGTQMDKVVPPLVKPPYGLSNQLIEILLAAFLRNRTDECLLIQTGGAGALQITGEIFNELVRQPEEYILFYSEVTIPEREYLNRIIALCQKKDLQEGISLWENAKNALLEWFAQLPTLTKSTASAINENCASFIDFIQDTEKTEQAKEMLKQQLPQALKQGEENYDAIVKLLKSIRDELAGYAQAFEDTLIEKFCNLFSAKGKTRPELDETLKSWYNGLTEPQRLHPFSGDEAHLKATVQAEGNVAERICHQLPANMGLGAYISWEEDNTEKFITRVEVAKLRIEAYEPTPPPPPPPPPPPEDLVEEAIKRIGEVFEQLHLDKEKKEKVLWGMLEKLEEADD